MTKVEVHSKIDAPVEVVFRAVTDIANLPATNPAIVGIEFLTEQRSGVGTRFRETRRMKKKEMVTELEVTEHEPNRRARMVADSHGTVWDTVFEFREIGGATEFTIAMDARPHAFLPKLLTPVFKGLFRRGIAKHMEEFKTYCESLV